MEVKVLIDTLQAESMGVKVLIDTLQAESMEVKVLINTLQAESMGVTVLIYTLQAESMKIKQIDEDGLLDLIKTRPGRVSKYCVSYYVHVFIKYVQP